MVIGVWGDSITYGEDDHEGLGWVGRLRNALTKESPEDRVYNRGICGDTSSDVLARFAVEAKAIEPDAVIFAVGTNDYKILAETGTNKVSLDTYAENLAQLVALARTYTDTIFLVGLTDIDEQGELKTWKNRFITAERERYDARLRAFADTEGLTYISMGGALDVESDLDDGLHPNASGYEKMFRKVHSALG